MRTLLAIAVILLTIALAIVAFRGQTWGPARDYNLRKRHLAVDEQVREEVKWFSYFVHGLANESDSRVPELRLKDLVHGTVPPSIRRRLALYDLTVAKRGAARSWEYRVNPKLAGKKFSSLAPNDVLVEVNGAPAGFNAPIGMRVNSQYVYKDKGLIPKENGLAKKR